MTIEVFNPFLLTWTLLDGNKAGINTAVMIATLYSGRDTKDPITYPGTVVNSVVNVTMSYVTNTNGQYQSSSVVPLFIDDAPIGGDYVLVVDGTVSDVPIYHREERTVLVENTNN